ncbi:MAG: hypothetical protein ACLFNU_00475 [Bacteroidales bacterium]
MKRLCALISMLLMVSVAFTHGNNLHGTYLASQEEPDSVSKTDTAEQEKFDKLIMADGTERSVKVKEISDKFVFFSETGVDNVDWVDKDEVEAILYRDGTKRYLEGRSNDGSKAKDWRGVEVTRNADEVSGMVKVGDLEIRREAISRSQFLKTTTLETNAEIAIKKEAALRRADMVLIIEVLHHRAYGDPPVVVMKGEAYRK